MTHIFGRHLIIYLDCLGSQKSHRRPLFLKSMSQWRHMYSGWRLIQLCLHWRISRNKLWSINNNVNINNDSNKRDDWGSRGSNRSSATTICKYFCSRFLRTKLWTKVSNYSLEKWIKWILVRKERKWWKVGLKVIGNGKFYSLTIRKHTKNGKTTNAHNLLIT